MNSNSQSENPSNKEYNINNNKENSDISSNYKKRTLRDSELDHEELIINDDANDTNNINFNSINRNNFFFNHAVKIFL